MSASPVRRSVVLAATLLACSGAGTAAAAGAPDVLAPRLAEPRTPDVAVNEAGLAVAVWTARAGSGFAVVGRVRPTRTGAWRPPARLSGIVPGRPLNPVVSVSDTGAAVALWRIAGGPVQSASLRPGSATAWTRRVVLAGGEGFVSAALATRGGRAVASWADRADGAWRVHRRVRATPAAPWQADPALDLTAAGMIPPGAPDLPPAIAVSARGDLAVAWPGRPARPGDPGAGPAVTAAPGRVSVVLSPAGSSWGPATILSTTGGQVDVALGESGHAGVAWIEQGVSLTAAVREPQAAGWPAPERLVDGVAGAPSPALPQIALNREGYALAAWASAARTPGGLAIRARVRSGASGVWGPERTVVDDFPFFSIIELAALEAAIDDARLGHLAWVDPEGPGSAAARAAAGGSGGWRAAARVEVGEDINEAALAVSVRGGAVLVTPSASPVGPPNVRLLATGFPPPPRFAPSSAQLLINQRISQAAVRRVNAVVARLGEGLRAEHIRDGTLPAAAFGDGVRVEGAPTGAAVPPGPIAPLDIAPPGPRRPAAVAVTAAQLLVNQRISQAALRRANHARQVIGLGLTGAQIADGAITAAKLLPGLVIAGSAPVATPLPGSPVLRPGPRAGRGVALGAAQLAINQRIAQAAVLRSNWLVERLEGGLRGDDVRAGGLRHDDLAPGARAG